MVSQDKVKKKAPPRYSDKMKREIVEAANSGMSLGEILEKFPPRKRAVLRYLRQYDVKLKN